jgi:CheY-like chemotaxis protein
VTGTLNAYPTYIIAYLPLIYCLSPVILDISVGEIDGLVFLKQLKTKPETQGIPVLLLTLKAKWSDLQQSWYHKSQLAAAIVNPLEPTMFAVEIAKVLGWDLD